MSFDAMRWAMSIRAPSSTAKLLLLVMADFARAPDFKAYASAATLSERSQLDRKTVLANLERLQAAGLIVRLDEKAGRGGAPVYRLAMDVHRIDSTDTESGSGSATEPVPNFPGTDPVFPKNQYQFSHEPVPKTGHKPVGTNTEPVMSRSSARARDASSPHDRFSISLEWRPSSAAFEAKAKLAGAPVQDKVLFDHAVGEFISFWLGKPETLRNQAEWEHAFIASLKRYVASQSALIASGGHYGSQRSADALTAGYMTGAIPMPVRSRPPTQSELNAMAHGFATGLYDDVAYRKADPFRAADVIDMEPGTGVGGGVVRRNASGKPWDGAI